jgi:Zn-dependent peptidase ImmA (M78 family)
MRRLTPSSRIRAHVVSILTRCGITKPPVPVETIARKHDVELRYLPYEGQLSGMIVREGKRIIIGVNALHHLNRQRFTIAHELGHMILHTETPLFIDKQFIMARADRKEGDDWIPEEIEANRFASELLVPTHFLRNDLDDIKLDIGDESQIEGLAKRYKVSVTMMTIRINRYFEKDIFED